MTKRTGRIIFTVSLVLPPDARAADMRGYIAEAVAVWRGQLRPPGGHNDDDPGDPLWHLDPDSVRVTRSRRARTKERRK